MNDSRSMTGRKEVDDSNIRIDLAVTSSLLNDTIHGRRQFELIHCKSLENVELFVRCRNEYPGERKLMLTPHTSTEYIERASSLYLTTDLRGGVAVIGGELASLFSYPGARYGNMLVEAAKLLGARHLSCFDCGGMLPQYYGRHGFKEVARFKWDPQYAPARWNYDLFGTPDVVEMSL
ncbi:MAG: hypothetical protein ACK5Y6_08415 [Pseudomonadota bacterium]|jgi:hypothetical protein